MKIKTGNIAIVTILLLVCTLVGSALFAQGNSLQNVDTNMLPLVMIHGSFVYDTSNEQEAVGIADYVFWGNVISNDGTHYKNIITMEDENGSIKEVGTPYTDFTVQVLDNIKGKLKLDSPIHITKQGGVSQDNTAVYVFEDDELPAIGESYIFLAYAQEDGTLLISGPNSNILTPSISVIDNDENENIVYDTYLDAYENEIVPIERKRYVSKYEQ